MKRQIIKTEEGYYLIAFSTSEVIRSYAVGDKLITLEQEWMGTTDGRSFTFSIYARGNNTVECIGVHFGRNIAFKEFKKAIMEELVPM